MLALIFFYFFENTKIKNAETCSFALWIYVGSCWLLFIRRGCLISVNTRRLKTCQALHKKLVACAMVSAFITFKQYKKHYSLNSLLFLKIQK